MPILEVITVKYLCVGCLYSCILCVCGVTFHDDYESSILEYSYSNYSFKRGYIRICRKVVPSKTGSNEGWGSFAFLPFLGFLHQFQYQYQYQHLKLSISAGFLDTNVILSAIFWYQYQYQRLKLSISPHFFGTKITISDIL